MKHLFAIFALAAVLCLLAGCQTVSQKPHKTTQEDIMSMQQTYQFIKDTGFYFIATVDGDQPRVRPFGTIHIFEDKLYIQTGRSKNVGQQLLANGKAEICTRKGDEWIRVSGELVEDPRPAAKASLLEEYASLRDIGYSENDENTLVLYFRPGTVTSTIYSFSHDPIVMKF